MLNVKCNNFDEVINRRGTNSVKYDFMPRNNRNEFITPLWIADMDFKIPHVVSLSLIESAKKSIFGYTNTDIKYDLGIAHQ